jgi:hypothetical protein
MKKEFLKNFQVNGAALPDEVVDAILAEHTRDLDAAKAHPGANGGTGGKTFTQEEVNRIVSERLAREREKPVDDERERNLKAREARLDCRDYLDSKKYPAKLLDLLDSSDVEKFKSAADAMIEGFPSIMQPTHEIPPPYAAGTGTQPFSFGSIADAFKPPKI